MRNCGQVIIIWQIALSPTGSSLNLIFLFLGLLSYQNFIEIMMETMQAMTHWGKLKTVLEGYVGFDTVQEQIRKKSLKRGFEFNLMVVGKCKNRVLVKCKFTECRLTHPTNFQAQVRYTVRLQGKATDKLQEAHMART